MTHHAFSPEEENFETRLQNLSSMFRAAQADYRCVQRQCSYLQVVVQAKQEAIDELLPYYPHPLSPSLQAKIYM